MLAIQQFEQRGTKRLDWNLEAGNIRMAPTNRMTTEIR